LPDIVATMLGMTPDDIALLLTAAVAAGHFVAIIGLSLWLLR
jgi:hypothetical protein